MRVQPHFPSRPLVATVTCSAGSAWCACNAATNPAPPEPRIRMSVWSRSSMVASNRAICCLDCHVEIDPGEIDAKLDRLEVDDIFPPRQNLELEALLCATVVLDPR